MLRAALIFRVNLAVVTPLVVRGTPDAQKDPNIQRAPDSWEDP